MALKINSKTKIYILCPANFATGGPEALHQLGKELVEQGFNAFMYYLNFDYTQYESPVHDNYKNYEVPYTERVDNKEDNILIFPETYCIYLWQKEYKNLQKIIWWLSVTNFHISLENIKKHYYHKKYYFLKRFFKNYPIPTLKKVKKTKAIHIAHSYYSIDYLTKNGFVVTGQLSDYMHDRFLTGADFTAEKTNTIIYNPIKNDEFLKSIELQVPEFQWIPIHKGYTPDEVLQLMIQAKVYIDFGYHPGKEKMPREACLSDCCLIIGKDGSAKFKEDMPINEAYHFDKSENSKSKIVHKIRDCMVYYNENINDFSAYKKVLLNEKIVFKESVSKLFKITE